MMAGRIRTLLAGDREINELRLARCHPDSGKRRVEYFVVGEGANQLAQFASRALVRKVSFLKNDLF
jgi:hypothetical protein